MIIQIDNVLVSMDILTERFACDLAHCKGICCVEGDAGAPVTPEEIEEIEKYLNDVKGDLSVPAQLVIAAQGVAYNDQDGELVTSIVNGRDCVFTCYQDLEVAGTDGETSGTVAGTDGETSGTVAGADGETAGTVAGTVKDCCLCAFERAYRAGKTGWCKPISCALYPIRETTLSNGLTAITYHRWDICKDGVAKGKKLDIPLYKFLKEPLIKRFGEDWYQGLCTAAEELKRQGIQ